MSIKKYVATDKHPALKEGTTMVVRDDGSVNIKWMIASANILAMWIKEGWCIKMEDAKWTDSELKEMCVAYAKEVDGHIHQDHIEEGFDSWFTDRTNPTSDSFEVKS